MDTLCACGCGQPAPLAKRNDRRHGYVKDQPIKFIHGHNIRGAGAPWWKGDQVNYRALHTYLNRWHPKRGACEACGKTGRTEYALIHGHEHSRDRADYRELCKACHNAYDLTKDRGQPPLCKCGCGQPVTWFRSKYRWHAYVSGHYDLAAENRRRKK